MIAFELIIISIRKRIVVMDVVNDGICIRTKVSLPVSSYDFYGIMLSTEEQRRHMIKLSFKSLIRVPFYFRSPIIMDSRQ